MIHPNLTILTLDKTIPEGKRVWVMQNIKDIEEGKYHPEYYCYYKLMQGKMISHDPEEYEEMQQTLVFFYNKENEAT